MKKIICLIVTAFMLLLSVSVAAEAPAESKTPEYTRGKKLVSGDMVVVAENENVALSVNGDKALFELTNKKSGKVWKSNPELTKEESI